MNRQNSSAKTIGRPVPRKDGPAKVKGETKYIDDLSFEDVIYGLVLRSPVARGQLKGIRFEDGVNWDEFTVVKAEDIPGENRQALILNDQPCLAESQINHALEPIMVLGHANKAELIRAASKVHFDIEEQDAVYNIDQSLSKDTIIWGEDNVMKSYLVSKGEVDSVWDSAHKIIEGVYETGAQEQLYIENQGMVAKYQSDSGVTIWGSLQCPYYVQQALEVVFNRPPAEIRIVHAATGGGFGGKEEYPSVLAAHAALLAMKSGKTAKIIFDRAEDMAVTTKRHPSKTWHKMAVNEAGEILALDTDFVIDGGAYATLSSVVLSRGTIHAAGPYKIPNVRIRARAVATNCPPHGAFRGFGAPQSTFAIERLMNKAAEELGLDPAEFRRRNFLKRGDRTATQQLIDENVDMHGLLDRAFKEADYSEKLKAHAQFNQENSTRKRGIGFATFFHGAGFTGSGETYLKSEVGMEASADGRVRVLAASTEIGQGTNTVFSQIASDSLGIDYELIDIAQPDTRNVPNSGPTVASRTCMIVGQLVAKAAEHLIDELRDKAGLPEQYQTADFKAACQRYFEKHDRCRVFSKYKAPPNVQWDDEKYQGDAYGTYAWAVYVADVEIDMRTYITEVRDFVAVQEVGKVIHPVLAAGQIEGGVAQGVGFALYEKVVWDKGQMINNQMTNYIMPTAEDVPTIRVFFEEEPYAYGAAGAKGIGELPLDGSAPAIINAVEQALKLDVKAIPMLPEDLMELVEA